MGEFDDLIGEFVTESREHIADIEEDLIKIEADMENVDPEVINRVFRAAHSIKGSAKFLDLINIGDLAHKLEDVLNLIRSGKVIPSSDVASPLLLAADMLKNMLEDVTTSNDMDISEHLSQLQNIISGANSSAPQKAKASHDRQGGDILAPFDLDDDSLKKKLDMSQVYVLEMNIKKGNYDEVMSDLKNIGEVLETQEVEKGSYAILFSTIIESDMIPSVLNIDSNSFTQVKKDMLGSKQAATPQKKAPEHAEARPAPKKDPAPVPKAVEKRAPAPMRKYEEESLEDSEDQAAPVKEKILFRSAEEEEKKKEEENTSFITFSLENETYAVPIQAIEEIIGYQDISLLPNVPDFIKGVINLRGELVPIMDLRLKFRLESREYNPLTVFLIVRIEERVMGLVVDNVADVLVIDPSRVQRTPVFSARISTDFINGVYKDAQNQMVILVDVAALTKPEEWEVLAA